MYVYMQGGDFMEYTIKELRARKNETQQETAKAIGVSYQAYNEWEVNNSLGITKLSTANKLAKHFGVKLDEIFFAGKHE